MTDRQFKGIDRAKKVQIVTSMRKSKEYTFPNRCSTAEMYKLSLALRTKAKIYVPPRLTKDELSMLSYKQKSNGTYEFEKQDHLRRYGKYRKFVLLEIAKIIVRRKQKRPFWCDTHKVDLDYIMLVIGINDYTVYMTLKDTEKVPRDYINMGSDTKKAAYKTLISTEKRITDELFTLFAAKQMMQVVEDDIQNFKMQIIDICDNALMSGRLLSDEKTLVEGWKKYANDLADIGTIKTASEFFVSCANSLEARGGTNDSTILHPAPLEPVSSVGGQELVKALKETFDPTSAPLKGSAFKPINMYPPSRPIKKQDKFLDSGNIEYLRAHAPEAVELLNAVIYPAPGSKISSDVLFKMIDAYWMINENKMEVVPVAKFINRLPKVSISKFSVNPDDIKVLLGKAPKTRPDINLSRVTAVNETPMNEEDMNVKDKEVDNDQRFDDIIIPKTIPPGISSRLVGAEFSLMRQLFNEVLKQLDSKVVFKAIVQIASIQETSNLILVSPKCIKESLETAFSEQCETLAKVDTYKVLHIKIAAFRAGQMQFIMNNLACDLKFKKALSRIIKYLKSCLKTMHIFFKDDEEFSSKCVVAERKLQVAFSTVSSSKTADCLPQINDDLQSAYDMKLDSTGGTKGYDDSNYDAVINRQMADELSARSARSKRRQEEADEPKDAAPTAPKSEITKFNIKNSNWTQLCECLKLGTVRFPVVVSCLVVIFASEKPMEVLTNIPSTYSPSALLCFQKMMMIVVIPELFDIVMIDMLRDNFFTFASLVQIYCFWVHEIIEADSAIQKVNSSKLFTDPPRDFAKVMAAIKNLESCIEFVRSMKTRVLSTVSVPFTADTIQSGVENLRDREFYAPHEKFDQILHAMMYRFPDVASSIKNLSSTQIQAVQDIVSLLPKDMSDCSEKELREYIGLDYAVKDLSSDGFKILLQGKQETVFSIFHLLKVQPTELLHALNTKAKAKGITAGIKGIFS